MTTSPPTDLDLDEIAARAAALYEYATVTGYEHQVAADQLTGTDVPALVDEVRRLQAALAREERLHGDTIDDRARAQDAADRLAYAVAAEDVIGEHTADNSPWANALELITSKADVDKLRAELGAAHVQALNDLADRADPQRPEVSFFGDHGHEVGAWIRKQAEYEERRLTAEDTHVVADGSDDPEHVDDCPGCTAAPAV